MIWKKFSDEKPPSNDWYFIIDGDITKADESCIDIQEYDTQMQDFGVNYSYGGWESTYITIPKNLMWTTIKFPTPPQLLLNKIVVDWLPDPTDPTGKKHQYFKTIQPK